MPMSAGVIAGIGVAEEILGVDIKDLAAQAIKAAFSRSGDKKMRLGEIEVMAAMALIRANSTLEATNNPQGDANAMLRAEIKSLAQTIALILKRADLDGSSQQSG